MGLSEYSIPLDQPIPAEIQSNMGIVRSFFNRKHFRHKYAYIYMYIHILYI